MARASVKETQFARYFLTKLGAKLTNAYLITAVIAWLRQESGGLNRVIGNNPFNIRRSKYAIGYRHSKGNGYFAIFASLKMGAYAAAQMLIDSGHDYRGYWRIVAAAKRSGGTTSKDQQEQALDFLMAIALSKWDVAHYGTGKSVTLESYDARKNHLVRVWTTITGLPALPAERAAQPKQRKAKAIPPPSLNPPTPSSTVYLDPQQPVQFYRAVHNGSDLGNLPPP